MHRHVKRPVGAVKNPNTSRVNLVVRGFSDSAPVCAGDVVEALERLPDFHLEGLREIVHLPREALRFPSLGLWPPERGHAEYAQAERVIYVYRADDLALFRHVLHHEIGHHVFFLVLGSRAKKNWVTQIYPGSACATQYGYTSPEEDFAECYASYAQGAVQLEDFPRKLEFMRESVFSGKPGTLKEKSR